MKTASPISTKRFTRFRAPPVYRGTMRRPPFPSHATTRSALHQAANTPRPKAAVERPPYLRPSTAAGRLPTRDEAPRTPGRSFGAAAEGPNVTARGRKRVGGRAGLLPARPGPFPPRPGPRHPAAAPWSAAPGPGAPGSAVRVRGDAAHDRPQQPRQGTAQRRLRSVRSPPRGGKLAPGPRRRGRRAPVGAPDRSKRWQGELTATPPVPRQRRPPATGPGLPPLRRESHRLPPSPTLQDGGHISS